MAITAIKALLFLAGGAAAAAATAYGSGALDAYLGAPPPQVTALAPAPAAMPLKGNRLQGEAPPDASDEPAPPAAAPQPAFPPTADAPPESSPSPVADPARFGESGDPAGAVTPSFDIVRLESDGSMVIAGRAGPGTRVDVVAGASVIGSAAASGEGEFAVVLESPLEPGDYQISLRSTGPGETVASSAETAIVSVPKEPGGEVLAMVEEPGKPAELVSIPEKAGGAGATGEPAPPAGSIPEAAAPPAGAEPDEPQRPASAEVPAVGAATRTESPAASPAPAPVLPPAARATPETAQTVVVEAVEIEGRMVFVAGKAEPGSRVRAYADSILLGDAVTSPGGRFLIESERDLPVGDYVIRVDALGPDGATVVARAAVPFEREPGEAIAAVAPAADMATAVAPPAGSPPSVDTGPAAATADAQESSPAAPAAAPAMDAATAVAPSAGSPPGTSSSAGPDTGPATATADAPEPSLGAPAAAVPLEIAGVPPADSASVQPGEVTPVTAPKLQSVEGAVIIRRGDTLWRISRRVYGRGMRYSTIYLANQEQIRDPDRIWPGQVFKVPGKSNDGEAADMSRIGGQATTLPGEAGQTIRQ